MSSHLQEDPFLEEVFGLFALEAQEWISQCNTALFELEGKPSADRQAKLYESIICSVTNLGGSAATIELPALEELAFALVPLLQAMRQRGRISPGEQLAALQDGLSAITLAVEHLEETKDGVVVGLNGVLKRIATAAALSITTDPVGTSAPPSPHTQQAEQTATSELSSAVLLQALHDLDRARSQSMEHTRHVVDAVIRNATVGHGDHNGSHIEASTVMHILQELDAHDEQFLVELRQKLPMISAFLSELPSGQSDASNADPQTGAIAQDIQFLHEAARSLDAKPIMLFFHGLQTFLAVLLRREVSIMPQRFDAVVSRLQSILPMAQHWVEIGRQERASIEKVVRP